MQKENGNKNVGQAMPDSKGNSFWKNEIRLIIRQAEPDLRVTTTNAFTLIELLVVVLIIGILAAVALPQYQKAVAKSRATQAMVLLKSLHQAAVGYYMANGDYPTSFDELSVDIPWTGSAAGITFGPTRIKDTRSNELWSVQLYNASDGKGVYMTQLAGKYKGAGFTVVIAPDANIRCTERKTQGTIFELNEGDFCEKIMRGTKINGLDSYTYRLYNLP